MCLGAAAGWLRSVSHQSRWPITSFLSGRETVHQNWALSRLQAADGTTVSAGHVHMKCRHWAERQILLIDVRDEAADVAPPGNGNRLSLGSTRAN